MSRLGTVLLVARREVRERLRSRTFLASTGLQLLLVLGIVIGASIVNDEGGETFDVATIGAEARSIGSAAEAQAEGFDATVELSSSDDEAQVRADLDDGTLDAAVSSGAILLASDAPTELSALLQAASRSVAGAEVLREEGLSRERARAALDPPAPEVETVGGAEGDEAIAFFGVLLLYIGLITYGIAVTSGIVEEKSSRVIEVVLAAIRPAQLLAGKVVGIGLLGIAQVTLVAGAGVLAAVTLDLIELPASSVEAIVLVLVYFVLGYALYAAAFAVAGAIVSRQEDTQQTTTPLIVTLVAAYFVSIQLDPDSTAAQVCTFLPPVAPLIVPARAAQEALPAWELTVSLALMVVATVFVMGIARRVYERAVLRMGAPMKLREALRLRRPA